MTNGQGSIPPFEALRAGVDAMMSLDQSELSDGELAATILRFRRELDRQDAVFADLVVAGHRRGVGREDGYESTPSWLRARSGMRTGEVHAAIDAGELGEILPDTRDAWRSGQVSSGAVRLIGGARVAGYDDELAAVEPELLAAARRKDHWSLGRMTQHFKRCARRDGGLPPERDGLRASIVGGRLALDGDIGGLNAEMIYRALDAFTDAPTEGDDRTPAQRKADGLARMCRVAMGADPDTTMASLGAAIVVDWATFLAHLNREAFVRFGQMDGGFIGGLDPTDVETLLCDCTISGATKSGPRPRRSAAEPSSEGARLTCTRRSEHERTSRQGAGGRDVRSHRDGVKPITSNIGNMVVRPATRMACCSVPVIIISCIDIPTGRSSGIRSPSASSARTVVRSVPASNTRSPTSNPPTWTSPARSRSARFATAAVLRPFPRCHH